MEPPIVTQGSLDLVSNLPLHGLRAVNSELCVRLTRDALRLAAANNLSSHPQRRAGRYYSAMPAVLKDLCVTRFGKYTAKLT